MKPLTIVYTTARAEPHIEWFLDSLKPQKKSQDIIKVMIVDLGCDQEWPATENLGDGIIRLAPKPNLWQGKHRITKQDWWAKSNALNTGICLCQTEWIAFVDDRSVLGPRWLEEIRNASDNTYGNPRAFCGGYQKRYNMEVVGGVIKQQGEVSGKDPRTNMPPHKLRSGSFWFGCTNAMPLEQALKVNGYPEDYCDGHSYEDTAFGRMLHNNSIALEYKRDMMIIEDRTPGKLGPDIRREDKGVSPNDKSHALVAAFRGAKNSMNSYNIRDMRSSVLGGNPFPPPTGRITDWYDGQPIKDFA